ncbi:MAG: hypothetical protein U9R58_05990 [Chloroflexota bacterium]|nr:hypothetical protein [Chloroflexota bacterium]
MSYTFYPPQRSNAPGSSRLEMIVRESPTGDIVGSNDLEQVKLRIAAHEDFAETATLSHPWLHENQQRVCASKIAFILVTSERLIAFTFGGDLQIQPQNGETLFTLTSSAPILRLEDFNDFGQ